MRVCITSYKLVRVCAVWVFTVIQAPVHHPHFLYNFPHLPSSCQVHTALAICLPLCNQRRWRALHRLFCRGRHSGCPWTHVTVCRGWYHTSLKTSCLEVLLPNIMCAYTTNGRIWSYRANYKNACKETQNIHRKQEMAAQRMKVTYVWTKQ